MQKVKLEKDRLLPVGPLALMQNPTEAGTIALL
jgi:hypothetical protein